MDADQESGTRGVFMDRVVACGFALACALAGSVASAQDIPLARPLTAEDSALQALMAQLATQAIADYRDPDHDRYLDNLFRLQLVAGRNADAAETLTALRDMRRVAHPDKVDVTNLRWEIFAEARLIQRARKLSFDDAFAQSAREVLSGLNDKIAYQVMYSLGTPLSALEQPLREALRRESGKTTIGMSDALDLLRKYLAVLAYREIQPVYPVVSREDDARRYIVQRDIAVKTPDGATVCALVVRPRKGPRRLPALLNFTIYYDPVVKIDDARRTAANGYAGVEGFTRGKACSPDKAMPIEHDGADAATVIEWISKQPWSDGRVGMYGGSYEGFTQWAAAKRLPAALKAAMPSVSFSPGTDFPMEGGIWMNYAFPWPFYTTDTKALDDATYFDSARWEKLNRNWYSSGSAYRDLDKIDGTPNPIFDRWLEHPSYDTYWQTAVPSADEFARITIPVLTTTGYYDSGQIGALSYFSHHYQYNPHAEHYLVIGPYDHISGQRGTIGPLGNSTTHVLRGYELDPAAQIDIIALRYQWFDYIFKRGQKPAILRDKVNYEVMGADRWRHAPSLSAMRDRMLTFHLSASRAGDAYRLSQQSLVNDAFIPQTVDLGDRTDVNWATAADKPIDQALDTWDIVDSKPNIGHSIEFISDPFDKPTEVSGLFSGTLEFIANKRDFDFGITLFELTPKGEYFQLSYCWARASYLRDRTQRQLLEPGKREILEFQSGRLTSKQFQAGSRLVVVLGIIKQPGEEINYGTGKEVSVETIADAGEPLQINWFGQTSIEIPVKIGAD
jgi:putative CocE/NonD family hydrolase